jgi:uncharacterized protein
METGAIRIAKQARPALPYLSLDGDGGFLSGTRCGACRQPFLGPREVCARCGTRGAMTPERFVATGRVYSFTIVYRSHPGIVVPFVMAVVDLDDGPTLRGTLVSVPCEPEGIAFDLPVEVVLHETDQTDPEGHPLIAFFFQPRQPIP